MCRSKTSLLKLHIEGEKHNNLIPMAFLAPSIFWGKSPEDEVDILAVTQPRATTIYFDVIFR